VPGNSVFVEHLAKGLKGSRPMWRGERSECYQKPVIGRLDVRRILQRHLSEGASFIFHSFVVWANQLNQITLYLVRDHFQDVGQMLPFGA
jgi:hypothetical protein